MDDLFADGWLSGEPIYVSDLAPMNDAIEPVKEVAHYVTRHKGGEGAVREICELVLQAIEEIRNQ